MMGLFLTVKADDTLLCTNQPINSMELIPWKPQLKSDLAVTILDTVRRLFI
jgi:hypothetical protein